jgi:hypothetical protein
LATFAPQEQQPPFTAPYPFKWSSGNKSCFCKYDDLGPDIQSQLAKQDKAELSIDRYHLHVWLTDKGQYLVFLETLEQYEKKKAQFGNKGQWKSKARINYVNSFSLKEANEKLQKDRDYEFHSMIGNSESVILVKREKSGQQQQQQQTQQQPNQDMVKVIEDLKRENEELKELIQKNMAANPQGTFQPATVLAQQGEGDKHD